jgi:hypothetical protein
MQRRFRLEILLIAAIVFASAVFVRWLYIPTWADRHIELSEERYEFDVGEPGQWFSAWSLGDGQAYVMIAVDPRGGLIDSQISEAGYRFARAGYGWATWAISLGQETLVPYALAIVGALSLAGVVLVATRMRPILGPRSWLMVFNPALFIGFAGDTSETMGIFLLAVATAWGSWLAATMLGITGPTFLVNLWGNWRPFLTGVSAAIALALYGLVAFGADSMIPAGGRLGLPLVAYGQQVGIWGFLLASAAVATIVVGVKKRDWAWILAGLFVLSFGPDVVRDPVNAWRAAGFLPVMWAFGPGFEPGMAARSKRRVAVGHFD